MIQGCQNWKLQEKKILYTETHVIHRLLVFILDIMALAVITLMKTLGDT